MYVCASVYAYWNLYKFTYTYKYENTFMCLCICVRSACMDILVCMSQFVYVFFVNLWKQICLYFSESTFCVVHVHMILNICVCTYLCWTFVCIHLKIKYNMVLTYSYEIWKHWMCIESKEEMYVVFIISCGLLSLSRWLVKIEMGSRSKGLDGGKKKSKLCHYILIS